MTTREPPSRLVPLDLAAEITRVPVAEIRDRIADGTVRAQRISGTLYACLDDLEPKGGSSDGN